MTLKEALHEIDNLRPPAESPVSQQEVSCPEMKTAVRILSAALAQTKKIDPLYDRRQQSGALSTPPGSVLPG